MAVGGRRFGLVLLLARAWVLYSGPKQVPRAGLDTEAEAGSRTDHIHVPAHAHVRRRLIRFEEQPFAGKLGLVHLHSRLGLHAASEERPVREGCLDQDQCYWGPGRGHSAKSVGVAHSLG